MRECTGCGARISAAARFCVHCGAPVSEWNPASYDEPHQSAAAFEANPAPSADAVPPAGTTRLAATWAEASRFPFRYRGSWWMTDAAGSVLHWSATIGAWLPNPLDQTPFFMRRPRFARPSVLAGWTITLLILTGILSVGLTISALYDADLITSALENGRISASESRQLLDSEETFNTVLGAWSLSYLAAGILFIIWTRRITANLPSLGLLAPRYGTGWAIGGWFVPFLNFWRPVQIIDQAWRASGTVDPTYDHRMDEVERRPTSPLIYIWWITFIAFGLLSGAGLATTGADTLESIRTGDYVVAIAEGALAVIAVVASIVVYQLTQRQNIAHRQLRDTPADQFEAGPPSH